MQQTIDEQQQKFSEAYRQHRFLILAISKEFSRRSFIPIQEFESQLSEEFWIQYGKYDPTKGASLTTWLNKTLRSKASRITKRREGTYARRVKLQPPSRDSEGEESTPTLIELKLNQERGTEVQFESDVVDSICKKNKDDQRQLIAFILESSKIHNDPLMTDIIKGFEEIAEYEDVKLGTLAKVLGVHRNSVDRKLRSLARHFNSTQHGDLLHYLPNGVEVKREFVTTAS